MVQQDYILRMIQQYVAAIHRIAHLRRQEEPAEAAAAINDAYGRFVGLSPSLIHALTENDLIELLRARGNLDPARVLALAALLREEGDLFDAQGNDLEAVPRYLKALRLTLEVINDLEDEPWPDDLVSIDSLEQRLAGIDLPPHLADQLATYFEGELRFARAEDVRFAQVEAHPGTESEEALTAFYHRLLLIPDAVLAAGGMDRAEVTESLAELTA